MTIRGNADNAGERDTPMTGIYIAVVCVEAIIIAALWVLGRIYS